MRGGIVQAVGKISCPPQQPLHRLPGASADAIRISICRPVHEILGHLRIGGEDRLGIAEGPSFQLLHRDPEQDLPAATGRIPRAQAGLAYLVHDPVFEPPAILLRNSLNRLRRSQALRNPPVKHSEKQVKTSNTVDFPLPFGPTSTVNGVTFSRRPSRNAR